MNCQGRLNMDYLATDAFQRLSQRSCAKFAASEAKTSVGVLPLRNLRGRLLCSRWWPSAVGWPGRRSRATNPWLELSRRFQLFRFLNLKLGIGTSVTVSSAFLPRCRQ